MKARITIVRNGSVRDYEILCEVSEDGDGAIECVVAEDVKEIVWTRRFGEPQPFETGGLVYTEGEEIELTPEEDEEAKAAIEKLRLSALEDINEFRKQIKASFGPEVDQAA